MVYCFYCLLIFFFFLQKCHEHNVFLFCYLISDIYVEFNDVAVKNEEILKLVVSTIDPYQLQNLLYKILKGHLKILDKESLISMLTASLNWESFEQFCFWQILLAHSFHIDTILPVLPKLNQTDHAEALSSILLILKTQK